jgi:hypothetical protein
MQFELTKAKCRLSHFNARSEMNGEDRLPAADIKLELALTDEDLVLFGPELRSSWYDKDRKLRNAQLAGPFSWEGEIVGATLTIHQGLGGKSDLVVQGCTVNGFKLTPQEGGTVLAALRVQCHPGEKEAGKLYGLVQGDIEVSIQPAQAELAV